MLSTIEMYIKGILTIQKSLSLDGLYSMVGLMLSGSGQGTGNATMNMSIVEFRSYLQTLIDADVLECMDGMYGKQQRSGNGSGSGSSSGSSSGGGEK